MKKLTTISLFIFAVVVTALLVAGLVFYQDKKTTTILNTPTNILNNSKTVNTTKETKTTTQSTSDTTTQSLVLNINEIAKHNKSSDCWMLIEGKVYNVTSYFGKHPGGNATMAATCGTDATDAYLTKDPYASSAGSRSTHSSRAQNLLTNYYIGDLNQTISI